MSKYKIHKFILTLLATLVNSYRLAHLDNSPLDTRLIYTQVSALLVKPSLAVVGEGHTTAHCDTSTQLQGVYECLLYCNDKILCITTCIFNHLFNLTTFPECWSKGMIVPVYKKGDTDCTK